MRATRIVGHPPLTLPSASSHHTLSPPHALRNTLFFVVVSTLKAVPISIPVLLDNAYLSLGKRLHFRGPTLPLIAVTTPRKGAPLYCSLLKRCAKSCDLKPILSHDINKIIHGQSTPIFKMRWDKGGPVKPRAGTPQGTYFSDRVCLRLA